MSAFQSILDDLNRSMFPARSSEDFAAALEAIPFTVEPAVARLRDLVVLPKTRDSDTPGDPFAEAAAMFDGSPNKLFTVLGGSVNAMHPKMVKNVIPPVAMAYYAPFLVASLLMGNAVSGEDAGKPVEIERRMAKVLGARAGYSAERAGGLFSFGGTGTNLYGFRMGLARTTPRIYDSGLAGNEVFVGSLPAHFCHQTLASWMGLGARAYLKARSLPDQTTDLADLKETLVRAIKSGQRVATVVGAGGTTSCMGIDDFERIAAIVDELVDRYDLDYRPHIHADSVLGWVYLYFSDYDFEANPLEFGAEVLERIARISARLATLRHADSFGVDFHKTGFCPYNSSMVIVRDEVDLFSLGGKNQMMTPIFHDPASHDPGKFSFETSRSAANIVATAHVLGRIGVDGFRSILYQVQENTARIRTLIADISALGLEVVNPDALGSDVFVRVYPPKNEVAESICDLGSQFAAEQRDPEIFERNTIYLDAFFNYYCREVCSNGGLAAISKSSAAFYLNGEVKVPALRIYLLNPSVEESDCREIVDDLARAKTAFDQIRLDSAVSTDRYFPSRLKPEACKA